MPNDMYVYKHYNDKKYQILYCDSQNSHPKYLFLKLKSIWTDFLLKSNLARAFKKYYAYSRTEVNMCFLLLDMMSSYSMAFTYPC